ncbi:MAG: fibrinogen-like YCDxxxxGGGW domain-containing protein [Candidatus Gracilibacteria bacterium]|nr:fibrinogen-like YCDxxxxGGGW domain-containing protein [Candidatus Gracilibacteria bacterium]
MKKQQIKAFTLVELIIVITILAILATIGFMSYQSYTADARDGKRVADLGQMRNGLEIYQTKKSLLPVPDAQIVNIGTGGSILVYQGYAGTNVISKIKYEQVKDPKDNIAYTYSTNGDYTKFQLMSMLENGDSMNISQNPVNTTYAANNYNDRKTYVIGNKLGVFLDNTTNAPIQETISGNLDLASTGTTFKVVFSNTSSNSGTITGTGTSLYNNIIAITNTVAQTPIVIPVTYNWYLSGSSWIFKDSNNNITYPTTCNNLLTNSGTFYIAGSLTASGAGFKDGVYTIKPDSNPAFDVYCDMNSDSGGWTRIYKDLTSSENFSRLRNCNTNGRYFETNFECIKPTIGNFTIVKFTRSGYTPLTFNPSSLSFVDSSCPSSNTGRGCRAGWQISPVSGSRYTMREYNNAGSYNAGRWGPTLGTFQSAIIVYGK